MTLNRLITRFKTTKQIGLFATLFVLTCQLYAQQVTKTYYDFRKTQVDEEYQANSAGYINGYYKKYDRNGALKEQGSAINGKLNGEYRKWATYSGSRELASIENYKNGVLDGPAKYYGNAGIILRSGSFVNDEKDGVWEELYSNGSNGECGFFKSRIVYKNGKQESRNLVQDAYISLSSGKPVAYITNGDKSEGLHKEYYYPCKKTYSEYTVLEGQIKGIHKMYNASGGLSKEITYHYPNGKETVLTYKSYHPNGKVEYVYDASTKPEKFEGYNEDGGESESVKKLRLEQEKKDAKKDLADRFRKADSLYILRKYDDARAIYNKIDQERGHSLLYHTKTLDQLKTAFQYEDNSNYLEAYRIYVSLWKEMRGYKEVQGLIDSASVKTLSAMDEYFLMGPKLKEQSDIILAKLVRYEDAFVTKTNTGATYNGETVYSKSYPKGKAIFEKSRIVIAQQYEQYNNNLTLYIEGTSSSEFRVREDGKTSFVPSMQNMLDRYELGKTLDKNLDRMIELSKNNLDEYQKMLKKVEDIEEIKRIIGLL